MSAAPTSARPRQVPNRPFARGLVIAVAGGVLLALAGAFGTLAAPLGSRLAYWVSMLLVGGLWGTLCARLVERFIALDERPWLTVLLLTAAISGPLSVVVWAVTGLFFTGDLYPLAALPGMVVPVAIVTVAISAVSVFVEKARPVQTHLAATGSAPARFLDRLPAKLRGATLRAVEAEDHYLRLHTDRGSDLILMRLSDALTELEGLEGAQTHRSWWVARDAVRDVARSDGRAALTLEGGIVAPVSRRYARALREAGWY
jgi:DNA-binding LytR/AlgR family response regulator